MRLIFSTRRRHIDLEWHRREDEQPEAPAPSATPQPVGFSPNPTPRAE